MMFNTPQFIDVEDKIAGPLTWRQLLWMIGMGAVEMLIFAFFDGAIVFVLSVPNVLIFVALTFYRPNGQPLIQYLFSAFTFLFRPKVLMWDRPVNGSSLRPIARKSTSEPVVASKSVTTDEIRRIAAMVDKR